MANHNNYAKDRDLMMEAYASVSGKVPATSTTANPRMWNEEFKFGPEHSQAIPVEIKDEVDAKVLEIAGKPLGELSMTEYEAAQKQAHELYKSEGKELHAKHLEQSLDFLGGARDTVTTALDKATAEDAEGSPVQAAVNAVNAIANGDTSAVDAFVAAVDQIAAQGDDKVAAHEDLRDYINGSLRGSDVVEDLQDYLNAKLGHSENAEGFDMLDVHHFVDQNDITAAIKEFGSEAIKQYIDFMDEQLDAAPEDGE